MNNLEQFGVKNVMHKFILRERMHLRPICAPSLPRVVYTAGGKKIPLALLLSKISHSPSWCPWAGAKQNGAQILVNAPWDTFGPGRPLSRGTLPSSVAKSGSLTPNARISSFLRCMRLEEGLLHNQRSLS